VQWYLDLKVVIVVTDFARTEKGDMKKRPYGVALSTACIGLVLSFCIALTPASATTTPDTVHHVPVVLTNTTITVPKDQFVKADGITRYPRGALIDFKLENRGSKAISVVLTVTSKVKFVGANKLLSAASAGSPISPGSSRHFKLSFYFRGTFVLETLIGGKVAVSHPIIIF
jgi:hypothetical protein